MAEPMLVALKVDYKGEIHRLRIDINGYSFQELTALFSSTFALPANSFVIQYKDAEGDVLNVTSEPEYTEACRAYIAAKDYSTALRFSAVSRTQVAFQENVAEPILKAIEKLVETLKVTMEKVKQEQWAQRAQAGVEHTGEAIKTGVEHTGVALKAGVQTTGVALKAGVAHTSVAVQAHLAETNEILATAAADARSALEKAGELLSEASEEARESFNVAKDSMQLEKMIKDTGDSLKVAAATIGEFANDLVEEIRKHSIQVTGTPVVPTAPVETAVVAPEVVQPSEPEWEQVEQQTATEPVVVQTPVVVSPEEQKWATQIAMVRDILPTASVFLIIERLEQCNGNVEVVVNALMEDM